MESNINNRTGFKVKVFLMFTLLITGFLFVMLNSNHVSAQQTFFCAERTLDGAWCQNVPQDQIDTRFRQSSTSCEQTAFCKLGTCVDSTQGLCRPNVPQRVCQEDGGVWQEGTPDEIPQCRLGCCLLGEQASFTTQTHCTFLSSQFGTNTEFRTDIRDQFECIASANPSVKGACVIDDGFSRNCRMLTQSECQDLDASSSEGTSIEFHEGLLCSAESLGTICGPSTGPNTRTTCVEDKDEVYFLDTCGNVANIYNATRINDQDYWTEIIDRSESCNPFEGNSGSATCGSCAYDALVDAATCKAFESGSDLTPTRPQYGDFVCADLSCEYEGERYEHGEEWCGSSPGIEESLPGSEYHKLSCFFGEVTATMCDPFRNTRCIESEVVEDYSAAFCIANLWQSCGEQTNQEECEDTSQRDCVWIEGTQSFWGDDAGPFVVSEDGELVRAGSEDAKQVEIARRGNPPIPVYREVGAVCVPRYPPGFAFWSNESSPNAPTGTELCLFASESCIVKFTRGPFDGWDCQENCHCAGLVPGQSDDDAIRDGNTEWFQNRSNMCLMIGDCGAIENWAGQQGYWETEDLLEVIEDFDDLEEGEREDVLNG